MFVERDANRTMPIYDPTRLDSSFTAWRPNGRKARKLPTPDARRRDQRGRFADAKRGKASWSRRRFRHGCKGARYSPDANCLLSVFDHCLRSRHYVNVDVVGWTTACSIRSAIAKADDMHRGNLASGNGRATTRMRKPDVVMACRGDTPTLEVLAAVSILREHLPDLKIRVVNVVDLGPETPALRRAPPSTERDRIMIRSSPRIGRSYSVSTVIRRSSMG